MILEPIFVSHATELYQLFSDPELHTFVPTEVPTLEAQTERCLKWSRRISPKGDELWLNWAARLKTDGRIIGHFQAGVSVNLNASIGYVIGRPWQKQGYANEGLKSVLLLLKETFHIWTAKAWIDTRNQASIGLIESLGFDRREFIKNADHFKGSNSDEWLYGLELNRSKLLPK